LRKRFSKLFLFYFAILQNNYLTCFQLVHVATNSAL